ncbi:amidohydrolase family protein [Bradyrhizobium prioriisuperbiae]|uniref:amidohydrolase family protein n=1 Tax=Bradyrhizobium prioriisuperbiae TaxID=2854389 RepID=UPI0028E832D0|nr:amidohydrolase family protein [Bradyrhizobium prioritasuperba]
MGFLSTLGLRPPGPPRPAAGGRFRIDGVTVINPMHGRHINASLQIADGVIADISDVRSEQSADFAGCFALPGLVDMHVHLPPDNALKLTRHAALSYLAHGITSVREAGDLDGTSVDAARRLAREGVYPVPRVISCGPFVGAGKPTFRNTILLPDDSDAAADAAAISVKATGAGFMKFYDGLTRRMIDALARACARHGLKTMGHVPAALSYEDAGIAEVQHFFGVPKPQTLERETLLNRSCDWHAVDEQRMDAIVTATLKQGIANTPTIVTNYCMLSYRDFAASAREARAQHVPPFYLDVIWHPERGRFNNRLSRDYLERQVVPAIAKKQQLAKKLFDAGAQLYLGTDVAQPFILPGVSLHQEMTLFAEAGIGIEAVWKLATRDAGERLGVPGLGRIAAGAPADILLFRRDPTQSLDNLASLEAVISAGRLYRLADLKRALDTSQAYFQSPLIRPLARRGAERALASALRGR